MAEDGWSGQGDMTAERLGEISGRQTSFLSTPNWLMCGGSWVGKRVKRGLGGVGEKKAVEYHSLMAACEAGRTKEGC